MISSNENKCGCGLLSESLKYYNIYLIPPLMQGKITKILTNDQTYNYLSHLDKGAANLKMVMKFTKAKCFVYLAKTCFSESDKSWSS